MQLYNTLTRKLEQFIPQDAENVKLYTCGPTVYNYPHVGNWAAYIRWDMLRRTLHESGYDANWVMNITDVGHLVSDADEGEDKLEKGARREGRTAWEVADMYTQNFFESLQLLGIEHPNIIARATDHIEEQIALVKTLEAKGYTYIIDDGVYFDTSKFADYGKLARLKLGDLKAGARVAHNQQKRNPTDFALWKFSPKNEKREMEWESPWGKGFPGWHIECSAMAMKYLGETLDIHAGGIDHIPVHHTNEIAQSEAATNKPFARYWLHSNFINVDGTKISKSLGNDITLQHIAEKGLNGLDLRMLFLQSHYRTPSNFTWEGLQAARNRRIALQAFADLRFQLKDGGLVDAPSLQIIRQTMLKELQEDLRTPEALAALSDIVNSAENSLISIDAKEELRMFLEFLDRLLGLNLLGSSDISSEQKELIAAREAARTAKDFIASDELRNKLLKDNIALRDTPLGTIWQRIA